MISNLWCACRNELRERRNYTWLFQVWDIFHKPNTKGMVCMLWSCKLWLQLIGTILIVFQSPRNSSCDKPKMKHIRLYSGLISPHCTLLTMLVLKLEYSAWNVAANAHASFVGRYSLSMLFNMLHEMVLIFYRKRLHLTVPHIQNAHISLCAHK